MSRGHIMQSKTKCKLAVSAFMTLAMPILMAYELVGAVAYEWIGVGIFAAFIVHQILNAAWYKNLFKGKYTVSRTVELTVDILLFASMAGLMVSGILLSRYVFDFLPIRGGKSFARMLHLLSSYWGFILMSAHLELHWSMIMGIVRKALKLSARSKTRIWILRIAALLIYGFGIFAFAKHNIASYLFLQSRFAFFDYRQPVALFLAENLSIMGLFICISHYLSRILNKINIVKEHSK